MAKIQPLLDILNQNLQQFGIFSRYLAIDESMVPYFGHHSAKMFIRGKPIRFGYKVWSLCTDEGYSLKLMPYTGADPANLNTGPLGTRVVKNLIEVVNDLSEVEIYFDNFFTSKDLMVELAEMGVAATGTVRENCTGKCPLQPKKLFGKTDRGSYDYCSNGKVLFVQWHDSSVVTMATNHDSVQSLGKAKR